MKKLNKIIDILLFRNSFELKSVLSKEEIITVFKGLKKSKSRKFDGYFEDDYFEFYYISDLFNWHPFAFPLFTIIGDFEVKENKTVISCYAAPNFLFKFFYITNLVGGLLYIILSQFHFFNIPVIKEIYFAIPVFYLILQAIFRNELGAWKNDVLRKLS